MYFSKFKIRKRKGFTLVEMVIVVVILGILSSMALMKYNNVQQNAKQKADYATASTIATATIVAMNNGEISDNQVSVNDLVSKGYLQSDVKCNSTGEDFDITIEGDSVTVTSGKEQYYPIKEKSSQE